MAIAVTGSRILRCAGVYEIDRRASAAINNADHRTLATAASASTAATIAGESRANQGLRGHSLHPAVRGSKNRALASPATTTVLT